jgi:hypothetical protein
MCKFLTAILVVAIFFPISHSFAQKSTFIGYYINEKGDTVSGTFLHYTQWGKNPSKVKFLPSGSPREEQLMPQQVKRFVVQGYDEYISYIGPRLLNPIDEVAVVRDYVKGEDSVGELNTFLRLVTKTSEAELYSFSDGLRTNLFLKTRGQGIMELRYKKSYDQYGIAEIAEFRDQLKQQFQNRIVEKRLLIAFENINYTEEDITRFLLKLYPAVKGGDRERVPGLQLTVLGGIAFNNVFVHGEGPVPGKYNTSLSGIFSFGFILPFKRDFGKYFLSAQVKLFKYKSTGESPEYEYIRHVDYIADLVIMPELSGGVNLINKTQTKLFFSAGAGVLLYKNAMQISYLRKPTSDAAYGTSRTDVQLTSTGSFDASLGMVLIKRLLVSTTYMYVPKLGTFGTYSPGISGFQLLAGVKL